MNELEKLERASVILLRAVSTEGLKVELARVTKKRAEYDVMCKAVKNELRERGEIKKNDE